ncbi:MAG: RDD family protein [Myxococcota bacterium]
MADRPGGDLYAPLPTSARTADFGAGEGGLVLAELSTRFFAKLIDNLALGLVPMVFGVLAITMADVTSDPTEEPWFWAAAGVPMLIVAIVQVVLLTNDGQTIGKRALGIRIVNASGKVPGFLMGVVVRGGTSMVLSLFCRGFGSLADVLCIFREDRRCLHDHAAGTRVVKV